MFKGEIPDGFYLIGDSAHDEDQKVQRWLTAIIDSVREVTHIAPPDDDGQIIGHKVQQEGVISYLSHGLNVCRSVTEARYAATTEVYPDSAGVTDSQCNNAQVASVVGALDFMIKNR